MIYLIGLWGNVLPGLLLLLLVWRVAERFEPGYGAAAAVALGLGTMVLPLSTLLFSHVFTAFLGFAAFALMLRERDGPPSPMLLGAGRAGDGLRGRLGVPAVLRRARARAVPALAARRAARRALIAAPRRRLRRRAGSSGSCRCCSTTTTRFDSWTHLAYSDIPRQQKGFFGIGAAQPEGAGDAAAGLARAVDDLPGADHGRARHGAAVPAWQARRGADDRAASASATSATTRATTCRSAAASWARASSTRCCRSWRSRSRSRSSAGPARRSRWRGSRSRRRSIATITHPLVGYETETVVWVRYLRKGCLPADDRLRLRPRARLGRDLAVPAGRRRRPSCWPRGRRPRLRLSRRVARCRRARAARVGLFAALAPTVLGIDHAGLQSIVKAGDHTALNLTLHRRQHDTAEDARPDRRRCRVAGACWRCAAAQRPRSAPRQRRRRRRAGSQPALRALVPGRLDVAVRRVQLLAHDHVARRAAGRGRSSGPASKRVELLPPVQS